MCVITSKTEEKIARPDPKKYPLHQSAPTLPPPTHLFSARMFSRRV